MRAHQFLREYSREVTAQKLGQPLLQKFRKEPQQWQQRVVGDQFTDDSTVLQYLLGSIEKADPTKNKQYVPWIVRNYINSPSLKFEDAVSKVTEPLLKFYKLVNKKQIPAPNNDIGRIKDLAQLVQVVDQYPDVEEKAAIDKGHAKAYYDDADIRVIIPEDQKAACYYGQGTKWCTAATTANNMFDTYNKKGEMYIVIPKKPAHTGEKYQFHFQSKQFMDESDHRVSLASLRQRWPQLADIFAKQAQSYNILALRNDIPDLNATLQQALPVFRTTLKAAIDRESREFSKGLYLELGRAVRAFKGMEEIWELTEGMFDDENMSSKLASMSAGVIANDPDIASDEDQLNDELANNITDLVRDTELWIYITEMLEDMEETEMEFEAAMVIEGELNAMLQRLIPEVFDEAIDSAIRAGSVK